MESKIVFDVATRPFNWEPLNADAIVLAFGLLLIFLKRMKWRYAVSEKWGYFMILCAIMAASYDASHWLVSHRDNTKALASRHYEVVQGIVENFHPMPDDGSSPESFTISGHVFSYSDDFKFKPTTCFNQTTPHGGPIRAGIALRVKFTDDCILQIEELTANPSARRNQP